MPIRTMIVFILMLATFCNAAKSDVIPPVLEFVEPDCAINTFGRLCSRIQDMEATLIANRAVSTRIQDALYLESSTHVMLSSFFYGHDFLDQLIDAFLLRGFRLTVVGDGESIDYIRAGLAGIDPADFSALVQLIALDVPTRDIPLAWHAKLLMIEEDFGLRFQIITTSDNFRLAAPDVTTLTFDQIGRQTLSFESYQFRVLEPKDDLIEINRHLCFFEVASAISKNQDIISFSDDLERCLLDFPSFAVDPSATRSYFLPAERLSFLARVSYRFGTSDNIRLSSYNYDSPVLLELISQALRDGVDVKVLTDDDAYCGDLTYGDNQWISLVEAAGAQVRYIPTHNIFTNNSRYHLKELIFSSSDEVIAFTGSMNFTCAGLCRNTELMYEFNSTEADAFASHFDNTWNTLGRPKEDLRCN